MKIDFCHRVVYYDDINITKRYYMNWQSFLHHIREGNSSTQRFITNVSSPNDIGPNVCALANGDGGYIFVGMDLKNYHLVGADKSQEWVIDIVEHFISPRIGVTVSFVEKNDRQIMALKVSEGTDKPHYFKKIAYCIHDNATSPALASRKDDKVTFTPINGPEDIETIQKEDYLIQDIIKVSNFLSGIIDEEEIPIQNQEKKEYFESIVQEKEAQNASDSTQVEGQPSTETVLETVQEITEVTIENSKETAVDPEEATINDRQQKTVSYLHSNEAVSNRVYRELFNVSHKTAHYELVELVDLGYIQQEGAGRSTRYKLRQTSLIGTA